MTDLTEQWKKGELPEGVYYVLYYKNDTAEVDIYRRVYSLYDDSEVRFTIPQVTEVLAPVPSYDEWFKIKNLASLTSLLQEKNIECLHRENKLKELLKGAKKNCRILAQKLKEKAPDLEDWLKKNFGEYL